MEGLLIIPEFISEELELETLTHIDLNPRKQKTKINRTRMYGPSVMHSSFFASTEIPEYLEVLNRLLVEKRVLDSPSKSITINEYLKGQSIHYHVDNKIGGEVITVLSLLGDATMGMKKGDKEILFELPRRTLVQMRGEARWKWKHRISPVLENRVSIVFRKSDEKIKA